VKQSLLPVFIGFRGGDVRGGWSLTLMPGFQHYVSVNA